MDWLIPLVFLFLFIGLALGGLVSRRIQVGPAGYWVAGWSCLALTGVALSVPVQNEIPEFFLGFVNPLFPVMMLAGAFRYGGRAVPHSVAIGGLALCTVEGVWTSQGLLDHAGVLSLMVEPALCVSAAWLVIPRARIYGTFLQRSVAPGLLVIAWVEALEATAALSRWNDWSLLVAWVVAAFPVAALQLAAIFELVGNRLTDTITELQEAQTQMEGRIARRTAQLSEEVGERQRAEEELRTSEGRYRRVSVLMTDYAYSVRIDERGNFHSEWATGAFSRITGYESLERNGKELLDLVHPDDVDDVRASMTEALGGGMAEFECRVFNKDGEPRWIAGRITGEPDTERGGMVLYTAGHDITEEKLIAIEHQALQDRVRDAQRLESLGALAGGVAHDFNNLLSVILGNAAILQDHLPADSPLLQRAERIRCSARYAAEITTQMLTYAGSASLQVEVLDLSCLVEEMSQLIDAGTTRRVEIESDFDEALATIEGDPAQLRQVVLNLISNASEAFGEAGGQIALRTSHVHDDFEFLSPHQPVTEGWPGEYACLEVTDDGPGMDSATQARIFEPFFSTKRSGRGLGLSVIMGIVKAHSGSVTVTSQLGQGTTIRVLFPIATNQALPRNASTADQPIIVSELPAGTNATVLVIDDDEPVAELAEIFLTQAGFRVLVAGGGREGLELYKKHADRIGLVVLDLTMPDLTGDQVLEKLRLVEPGLPIIISSGYTHKIVAKKLGGAEFTDFVQKPYEPEELIGRVHRLLAESSRAESLT